MTKPRGARRVHGQGAVHPRGEGAVVAGSQVVTTGQHRDPSPGGDREVQDLIGQATAGMDRDQQGLGGNLCVLEAGLHEAHAALEAGPAVHQGCEDAFLARRALDVHAGRGLRGVIQQDQDRREQAVARGELHDGAAAHLTADPPGGLPGLEELLARQALGLADGPGDAREEAVSWEALRGPPVEHIAG